MIDAIASAQVPWPNTETKIVLVCRVVLPSEKYGGREGVPLGCGGQE
jgi:hypothetical protein